MQYYGKDKCPVCRKENLIVKDECEKSERKYILICNLNFNFFSSILFQIPNKHFYKKQKMIDKINYKTQILF